jgi:XTP/dITP diphosphohydrolase
VTRRIVLATANPGKAREIRSIMAAAGVDVQLLARPAEVPEVEERGATLLENAVLKAYALRDATGLPALADDTGLEVDALGGAPGVRSARYAGPGASDAANVDRLLRTLAGARRNARTARFRTVVVLASPGAADAVAHGVLEGTIADAPRGGGGFGYDPVFLPAGGGGRTLAELSPAEKDSLSHRGRALGALAVTMRDATEAQRWGRTR